MKIRLTMPGAAIAVEVTDHQAKNMFKELAAQLLGMEPVKVVKMQMPVKVASETVEAVQRRLQIRRNRNRSIRTRKTACRELKSQRMHRYRSAPQYIIPIRDLKVFFIFGVRTAEKKEDSV